MKSHPTAVDVPARWAEVCEARRDMPELSDFLKIQPDKSPAVEELVQVVPKKFPPKPAETTGRPLKLQRQNVKGDQKHAVPAEAEARPAVSPGVAEAPAKILAPEASETPSQGKALAAPEAAAKAAVPQSVPADQAGTGQGESKASMKRAEAEAWKVFSQQMGPGWQKRFAAHAAKRLEKLKNRDKKGKDKKEKKKEKKKHKKEKAKAKGEKKEKQDKARKGDKKDKKSKNDKGQKERGQKRALLDDDDLAVHKGRKEKKAGRTKPAGQEQKDEAQAAAGKKAAAKAKTAAKAKAQTKPKAKAGSAAAKAKTVAIAPKPLSASGLAASLDIG